LAACRARGLAAFDTGCSHKAIRSKDHESAYRLTPNGRAIAVLFTKAYGRVLGTGLTALAPDYRLNWPNAARSLPPGANSAPWTKSSTTDRPAA